MPDFDVCTLSSMWDLFTACWRGKYGIWKKAVWRVAAADLSPASVNGPDVFLSVSRKCDLPVSGVQMLHRRLLRRKLLHTRLVHTGHTHHTQA